MGEKICIGRHDSLGRFCAWDGSPTRMSTSVGRIAAYPLHHTGEGRQC